MTLASTAKASPLDQTRIHARPHHRLEYLAEQIAVANRPWREGRVVGDLVVKIEAAEPAIGEVQLDLLVQLPLEANAVGVTDDEPSG
jgi:hypothetical protein